MNAGTQELGNSGTSRSGFTIVELLMVIGIISVLISITVSAVSGSIQRAREQKARAICTLVSQGIQTYYAQKDEWPVEPGTNPDKDGHYVYSGEDVRQMIKVVVEQAKGDSPNPMIDAAGLYVSRSKGEPGEKGTGTDFMTAVMGTKREKGQDRIALEDMYFGYPRSDGKFRRFVIKYMPQLDSIMVRQFTSKEEDRRQVLPESEKDY